MQTSAQESETESERLAALSRACLKIHASLDMEEVLNAVAESAQSATGARYAVVCATDDNQRVDDWATAGFDSEQRERFEAPDGQRLLESLVRGQASEAAEFRRSLKFGSSLSAAIQLEDEHLGWIWIAREETGREFPRAEEQILAMLTAQAAAAMANARRHTRERQARADLLEMIDTSPVGVVMFDAEDGLPTSVNREALRIARDLRTPGRPLQQLGEVLICRRADGRAIAVDELPVAQALSTGEAVRAEEIVVQTPDGRSLTTLVNAAPIRSHGGAIESVVVTLQDLTALEELERLRAEFLGTVSHELRAPLTSIKGSTTTLLNELPELDPAEARRFIEIINAQADMMRDLISQLLDAAAIEAGTLSVQPEPSDLTGLVEEARNLFLGGDDSRPLMIDFRLDLPRVQADRRRIVQVLGNLLANAARRSESSSVIRLAATNDAREVTVTVSIEHAGHAAPPPPDPFGQFPWPAQTIVGDEGLSSSLGLAICKGIVEAHGGRLWVERDRDKSGTGIAFTLAITEPSLDRDPRASGAAQEPAATQRTRVLVVDDDPQALNLMRHSLTSFGFAVIVAADPTQALQLVQARPPDLVVLDLVFPGADGIELMAQILECADLPVLFVSAYGRGEIIVQALDQGADDYIVKPVSPTELAARMRAVLRRRSAPDALVERPVYRSGDLLIDYSERRVTLAGRSVRLAPTEYELLVELSLQAGRVLTHEMLLQRIWGLTESGETRFVRGAVKRLRRKLGDDGRAPRYIVTEPRVGYRLAPADEGEPEAAQ